MTRVAFLDLSRRIRAIRGELDAAAAAVLDEGRFVLTGRVEAFERAFAGWCGTAHCVGVASGTDAVTLALQAVGVRPGDEVVTAANTCVPTVAGIEAAGATPVLVDVDPLTFTLDTSRVERALTPRTRAVVPVHLYGQCADMAALSALARAHDLTVVEDAAQAHGAELDGRKAGTFGDAAAFSFYPTKNLGALGDAGAVVTDDESVAERVRLHRSYGEREKYVSVLSGRNSRLDALQAAFLSAGLPHLDAWNERRHRLADRYHAGLAGSGVLLPAEVEGRRHAYHLFVLRVSERDRFRAALADAGVETLVHYPRPIHRHPAYMHLDPGDGGLSISERLCDEVVSLPLYPELSDAEADRVVEAVRETRS